MHRITIPFCLFIVPVGFYLCLTFFGKNTYQVPIYHPAGYVDNNPYTVPHTLHPYLRHHRNTLVGFIDEKNVLTTIIKKIMTSSTISLLHNKYNLQIIFVVPQKKIALINHALQQYSPQNMLPYQILVLPILAFQKLRRAILLHTTQKHTLTYVDSKKKIRGYYAYPYRKKAIKQLIAEVYLLNNNSVEQ